MTRETSPSATLSGRRLEEIKGDVAELLAILQLERPGPHCKCPLHEDETGSLSVWNQDNAWLFKCHSCGASGSVVDALALTEKITAAEAIAHLLRPQGVQTAADLLRQKQRRAAVQTTAKPPAEPIPPVPDEDKLRRVHERAMETLFSDAALQRRWLGKRGIPLSTAQKFGLGFMPWLRFEGWKHSLKDVWVIPISDANGKRLALKLHRENPQKGPKCSWAPIGTEPKKDVARGISPRHGYATFFLAPEWGEPEKYLFLCPGELKALAISGAGFQATAITAGESWRWTPGSAARLTGRKIVIVYDDDPAGIKFKNNTIAALVGHASLIKAITFGCAKPAAERRQEIKEKVTTQ
jgi:hypothetical protein